MCIKKEKGILQKDVSLEWIIFIIIVGMIVVLIVNDDGSSSNSNRNANNDMVCYDDEDGRIVCDEYYNPANDREYEIRTGYDG